MDNTAKRFIMVIFTLMLMVIVFPLSVFAEKEGDYEFTVSNDEATITNYLGNDAEVVIPSTLSGYSVTKIGYRAFIYDPIESVVFPEGLISIEKEAFAECKKLKSITIPSSLEIIGFRSFLLCDYLESIHINDLSSWCEIEIEAGNSLFQADYAECILYLDGEVLTEEVIPEGTTKIHGLAFSNCDRLTHISIPKSVTKIHSRAFTSCPTVTIHCEEGSAAYAFAMRQNIPYVIENSTDESTVNTSTDELTVNTQNVPKDNYSFFVIAVVAFCAGVGITILVMKKIKA